MKNKLKTLSEAADRARERCSKMSKREKYQRLMKAYLVRKDYLTAAKYRDLMRSC